MGQNVGHKAAVDNFLISNQYDEKLIGGGGLDRTFHRTGRRITATKTGRGTVARQGARTVVAVSLTDGVLRPVTPAAGARWWRQTWSLRRPRGGLTVVVDDVGWRRGTRSWGGLCAEVTRTCPSSLTGVRRRRPLRQPLMVLGIEWLTVRIAPQLSSEY